MRVEHRAGLNCGLFKLDRTAETDANINVQHLSREIFSEGQFAAFRAKFYREFKGEFS